ncbi:MAG: GxxExxY protein [Patescibacteria group bacterium]|jgi:GxxExxY protein
MFLHKELSWKIIGICMKIQNEYGSNHNERIYHSLLIEQFTLQKINFLSKPKIPVLSKQTGKKIGLYEPDFLIEKLIILEIKAKPFNFKKDETQLQEYLNTTPYEIGYLVNFGFQNKLYFKRIICTNNLKNFLSLPKKLYASQ